MIQFHIIYTPGTAIPLSRFALTILLDPACQVRLVANGCTPAEERHLAALGAEQERISFLRLPGASPVAHGAALNYLQRIQEGSHFAVIDSDIFTTGPFLPPTLSAELTCILPPAAYWDKAEEARQRRRHRMGCTYFAIYDNAALTRLRLETGIGFDKYRWHELTGEQQAALRSVDYVRATYDTGKALDALMSAGGAQIFFADPQGLRHLGGFSRSRMQRPLLRLLLRYLHEDPGRIFLPHRLWKRLQRARRKQRSNRYYGALLHALSTNAPLPSRPRMGNRYIEEKMREVSDEVIELFGSTVKPGVML